MVRQPAAQVRGDPASRLSIPEFRNTAAFSAAAQDFIDALQNERTVASHQRVGALLDRDRAFGIGTHREARHAERRGFFLHSDTNGEPDTGEHENPEGFIIRARISRPHNRRTSSMARQAVTAGRLPPGRSRAIAPADDSHFEIRSRIVTGIRQRAHSPR